MSQRYSGYARKDWDLYETPEWVTEVLLPHIGRQRLIWEPACGGGKMVEPLKNAGDVFGSDIRFGRDFLASSPQHGTTAIITNPPYTLDQEFCEHALALMKPVRGVVAMLLRSAFDHAKTRRHLFAECPAWSKRIVLTKRIVWFDGPVPCRPCNGTGLSQAVTCKRCKGKGEVKNSPSENHTWFVWDWRHAGPATNAYGPVGGRPNKCVRREHVDLFAGAHA